MSRTFLLLTLSILLSRPIYGQESAERWTPELAMSLKTVGGTAFSPGGDLVAFTVREALMEGEQSEFLTQIWMASVESGSSHPFTTAEQSSANPQFSPDGSMLAFTSSRSDKSQVWIIPVHGGEASQLTTSKTGVGGYIWSPDSKRIAYVARDPDSEEEEKRDKEKRDVLVVDIGFKYGHIYVVTAHPGEPEPQQITTGDFHVTDMDWSPDGETIVFAHQIDPRINSRTRSDISTVPADSGAVRALYSGPGTEGSPRYSPDGSMVAFASSGARIEDVGLSDVYVIDSKGGEARRLAETYDRSGSPIEWAPDGESVVVAEPRDTGRVVYALPVDGSEPRALTPLDGVAGSPSFSGDGTMMAFTWQAPESPANVFVSATGQFSPSQVSEVNASLQLPDMARTEQISWTSPDGMPIEGLLTYPAGYSEGDRVPLVLQIHGGPGGVFSRTFTGYGGGYQTQVFAEAGYAVLRPNPRGSTGYGQEFRYANVKDWGFGDYEDVMSGVDHVITMGVAHSDSLTLMGWSYGGYLTSFAVTRTDRFKAASMGAGLPNLISMVTTTDIPDYLAAHMGGEFWNDYETYEKHSAMYRIENVVTPTQVMHGSNDLRVPFTQGQEFYVALQRRGIPTEMIVYPRSGHGPSEPKLRMDTAPRVIAWFDKHLGR